MKSLGIKAAVGLVIALVLWIVAVKVIGIVIGKAIFWGAVLAVVVGGGYYVKSKLFGGRKTS